MIGPYRVIDLTRRLVPEVEKRRLIVRRSYQQNSLDYHSDLDITSHLGTHVESPYHYKDEWPDIAALPVTQFMGRAVRLHMETVGPSDELTADDLERADGGRVRPGDITLLTSPFHCEPFSNDPHDQRPWLSGKAASWLKQKKVKAVALGDSVAIEHDVKAACEFHEILMPRNVVFIEVMENLEKLTRDIFFLIYLPLPIVGLDSCPARVVAIEGIPGLSQTDQKPT